MKGLPVWKMILDDLRNSIPVMLLYVVESKGSSPGRQGFCMSVNAHNKIKGSIGGGIMEHKFVEMAREELRSASWRMRAGELRRQIHDKSVGKDQSGMICSGEQTIFLYNVSGKDKMAVEAIVKSLEANRNAALQLSPGCIEFSEFIPGQDYHFHYRSEEEWNYVEKTGYKNNLFIIGGGHCSLALSKLMNGMDFRIHVFDNREDLNTISQNDVAHEKHIIDDYDELKQLINDGDHHYVVIMSFGYRTDDRALRALLGKKFKYMGLLGSRHKIEKMLSDLRNEGIEESEIKKIHSPIGIPIHSHTPEEIAVSIAAEIIAVKNNPHE